MLNKIILSGETANQEHPTKLYLHMMSKMLQRKGKAGADVATIISEKRRTEHALLALATRIREQEIEIAIYKMATFSPLHTKQAEEFFQKFENSDSLVNGLHHLLSAEIHPSIQTTLKMIVLEMNVTLFKMLLLKSLESLEKNTLPILSDFFQHSYKQDQHHCILSLTKSLLRKYSSENIPPEKKEKIIIKLHFLLLKMVPYVRQNGVIHFLANARTSVEHTNLTGTEKTELISLIQHSEIVTDNVLAIQRVNSLEAQTNFSLEQKNDVLRFLHRDACVVNNPSRLLKNFETIVAFYQNDSDIAQKILTQLRVRIQKSGEFVHHICNYLTKALEDPYENTVLLLILLESLSQNNLRIQQNKEDEIVDFLQKLAATLDYRPRLLVQTLKTIASHGRTKYFHILKAFLDHPQLSVRSRVVEIYSGPNGTEIDLLVMHMLQSTSFQLHRSVQFIFETKTDNPVEILYPLIKNGSNQIAYWRAINLLASLRTGLSHYSEHMAISMFTWSDTYLRTLQLPAITEPDVQDLLQAMSAKLPGFTSLSVSREVRHRHEPYQRRTYVVSCSQHRSASDTSEVVKLYFLKQCVGHFTENEVEGTSILYLFGVKDSPQIELVEGTNDKYFLRQFIDGFDLGKLDALTTLRDRYSGYEILEKLAYALGRVAVQSDLLGKGDYGGGNELVIVNANERLEIDVIQIDLSSSFGFDKSHSSLGLHADLYELYLSKVTNLMKEWSLDYVGQRAVIAAFFNGIHHQFNSIREKLETHSAFGQPDLSIQGHFQVALKRVKSTGDNILSNIYNIFNNGTAPNHIIIDEIAKRRIPEWSKIDTLKRDIESSKNAGLRARAERQAEIVAEFNSFCPITNEQDLSKLWISLRTYVYDKQESGEVWLWDGAMVRGEVVSNAFLSSMTSRGYDFRDMAKLLDYLRDNLVYAFYAPRLDLLLLLEDLAQIRK